VAIEVLLAGRVRGKRRTGPLRHLPGGWSDSTLPVTIVLIDHPGGLCLFDAGPGPRVASENGLPWHPWLRLARFEAVEPGEPAAALARRGASPGDIRWVVLSHLHVDHVGGLASAPRADIVVSRMEWARAEGLRGRLRGYVPDLWPEGREPVLVEPELPAVGPFPGGHDLAGDGTLLVVPTPEHTPGHVSVIVEGATSIFIAGDTSYTEELLKQGVVDGVSPDEEVARQTNQRILALARERPLVYLPSHDPQSADRLARLATLTPQAA